MYLNNCQIHKTQPAIYNKQKNHIQQPKLCQMCIQELDSNMINFQDINQEFFNLFSQQIKGQYNINQKYIIFLIDMKERLQNLKSHFENSIEKFIGWLKNQIISITIPESPEELFQKIKIIDLNSLVEGELKIKKYMENFQDIKGILLDKISSLFQNSLIRTIKDNIQKINFEFQNLQAEVKELQIEKEQKSQNAFIFEKLDDFSIKESKECYVMAFNKDCSILIVGCRYEIRVYTFLKGFMNQIQKISNKHTNNVWTLNFMKKSNRFISGSYDDTIIIWVSKKNNQYICQQKLENHISNVYCVVLNKNEDLIVSGSDDKTIRFWIEKDRWVCQQVITDHKDSVFSISLNQKQNKLISCSYDKTILVIEKSLSLQRWVAVQKINVEYFGCRLCFINDNQFTFQPQTKEYLSLYELNIINNEYRKVQDIDVQCGSDGSCLFPQQFIKQKGILLNKNGQHVNFISVQNANFRTEQSIDFGTDQVFGQLSDDGQYLITWDNKSQEIQIRELKEI
ncbi:unnamed protein product (macronuclear) [Paramecium tetraurelia]|uniref:Uncharacterized protein n=1 Tax=Paramecium tetraurelia TaxID=5888 RepID=A0DE89_PARTE|nr:uncharacterized protein GSPATT00016198001 [Paramecium tetraurelia]CAK81356.1 unnamed protein product [Paramecium tetraurelia]|eukprot:XP_001448753.1 hypothetical protein (macronuclear) [Paramecium tetraurelia strain d4-2]